MSANNRQPTALVIAKGKKHLTKDETEERLKKEPKAPSNAIVAPKYLSAKQRREFDQIAKQLKEIGIMANVDCDVLAMFVKSRAEYVEYGKMLNDMQKKAKEGSVISVDNLVKVDSLRDKSFKRCLASAKELGLSITSRCRIVMPKAKEDEEQPVGMQAFLMGRDRVG